MPGTGSGVTGPATSADGVTTADQVAAPPADAA
jgi:hypothetical protein